MAATEFRLECRIAWWLPPYLRLLAFFCWLHGSEPDWEKLERKIKAAVRTRIVAA